MVSTHVRGPVIAALARCNAKDIEKAAWALEPAPRRRIHVFIATSDTNGECDASLRAGRPGLVRVLDDRTPAYPVGDQLIPPGFAQMIR
jgi:hypothetical protein